MTAKNWGRGILAAGMMLFLGAGPASAVIVGGPSPFPGFGDDDGTELFLTGDLSINVEIFDLADGFSNFGFYYSSDPSTLITVFDAADTANNAAVIDFANGFVFDVESGLVETTFTPSSDAIGFFLAIPAFPLTLYTEPDLNPSAADLAATFPGEDDPSLYLIGFEGGDTVLSFNVATGLEPVRDPALDPIPEPTAAACFALGFGLVGASVRRRRR